MLKNQTLFNNKTQILFKYIKRDKKLSRKALYPFENGIFLPVLFIFIYDELKMLIYQS